HHLSIRVPLHLVWQTPVARFSGLIPPWQDLAFSLVSRRASRENRNAHPQSFSYGCLQKGALASIFSGSFGHLSLKNAAERTFRSVSNGRRGLGQPAYG